MVQHHPDGGPFFAVRCKFRPVVTHGGVEVELAGVGEHVGTERGGTLGAGEHGDQRVGVPRGGRFVRRFVDSQGDRATPQVDDRFAVDGDADRRADFAVLDEVAFEGALDVAETRLPRAVEGCHGGSIAG